MSNTLDDNLESYRKKPRDSIKQRKWKLTSKISNTGIQISESLSIFLSLLLTFIPLSNESQIQLLITAALVKQGKLCSLLFKHHKHQALEYFKTKNLPLSYLLRDFHIPASKREVQIQEILLQIQYLFN